jgi:hypothetical protein
MTDQQSLDDIAMLLMKYPGVSSAAGGTSEAGGKVWIRFRCGELESLKAIASCAVAANVLITIGDPETRCCYEAEGVTDLPFDMSIKDYRQPETPPTASQIFGVFLAWNLKEIRLIDSEFADQLLRGWHAVTR